MHYVTDMVFRNSSILSVKGKGGGGFFVVATPLCVSH